VTPLRHDRESAGHRLSVELGARLGGIDGSLIDAGVKLHQHWTQTQKPGS